MGFKVGDRVKLNSKGLNVSYVQARRAYTNMYVGKRGKVVRIAGTGKIGVEFDDIVFTQHATRLSSHDNGCHGSGLLHYCWYIPDVGLESVGNENELLLLLCK